MSLPVFTRRNFLQTSLAATALSFAPRAFAEIPGLTYGVQLFMLRSQAATDLPGVFRAIHTAGYSQVELFPIAYNHPAAELRRMVADAGLGAVAGHFDYAGLAGKLDYAHDLGLKYMVCPMIPKQQWSTLAGFRQAADLFNQVGKAAKSRGMEFVFHDHDYEFRPLEGSTGFAELMRHTDPALVKLELDMYWLAQAGQDPLSTLKAHAGRVRLVHLKDRQPNVPISYDMDKSSQHITELGRGNLDWRAILLESRAQGIQYAFLDQDETTLPLPESMKISRDYLRTLKP